jgi:hypothetical protein
MRVQCPRAIFLHSSSHGRAGHLRRHEERFFPFIDGGMDLDMASYCRREVEPTGRECEQLHIVALTEYLGLRVAIEYLDGR